MGLSQRIHQLLSGLPLVGRYFAFSNTQELDVTNPEPLSRRQPAISTVTQAQAEEWFNELLHEGYQFQAITCEIVVYEADGLVVGGYTQRNNPLHVVEVTAISLDALPLLDSMFRRLAKLDPGPSAAGQNVHFKQWLSGELADISLVKKPNTAPKKTAKKNSGHWVRLSLVLIYPERRRVATATTPPPSA